MMRKVVVGAFVSLDSVMQAPGGPEEDPTGGFAHGGWSVPYWDSLIGAALDESFAKPFDLLLGRKTYDIFAAYWPHVQADPKAADFDQDMLVTARKFDEATKYVATQSPETLTWRNSKSVGTDIADGLRRLKSTNGPDLIVQGSSELIQTLLANDLVDEFRLLIYPLVLGKGKRLFGDGTMPAAFKLEKSSAAKSGVLLANYGRAGEIEIGSFAMDEPTQAENERREAMRVV